MFCPNFYIPVLCWGYCFAELPRFSLAFGFLNPEQELCLQDLNLEFRQLPEFPALSYL
jgi:hypothetical protein